MEGHGEDGPCGRDNMKSSCMEGHGEDGPCDRDNVKSSCMPKAMERIGTVPRTN